MVLLLFSNFPIVFLVLKEILRLAFLNNSVMNLVCSKTYINFTHFVYEFFSSFVFVHFLFS